MFEPGSFLDNLHREMIRKDYCKEARQLKDLEKVLSFNDMEEVLDEIKWLRIEGGELCYLDWSSDQIKLFELVNDFLHLVELPF